MKANLLLLFTATVLSLASVLHAGPIVYGTPYYGYWNWFNAPRGPGSTGGELYFTITSTNMSQSIKAEAATPVTDRLDGFISVPRFPGGLFSSRVITGTVSSKGVIRGRFQGGVFRGHVDRRGHDAAGSIYLNMGGFMALSVWFADVENGLVGE